MGLRYCFFMASYPADCPARDGLGSLPIIEGQLSDFPAPGRAPWRRSGFEIKANVSRRPHVL